MQKKRGTELSGNQKYLDENEPREDLPVDIQAQLRRQRTQPIQALSTVWFIW